MLYETRYVIVVEGEKDLKAIACHDAHTFAAISAIDADEQDPRGVVVLDFDGEQGEADRARWEKAYRAQNKIKGVVPTRQESLAAMAEAQRKEAVKSVPKARAKPKAKPKAKRKTKAKETGGSE